WAYSFEVTLRCIGSDLIIVNYEQIELRSHLSQVPNLVYTLDLE
ncbi:hypothetical protein AVEN_54180-1, partial [Araneus ventricosus]